jgi:hypothetical protein
MNREQQTDAPAATEKQPAPARQAYEPPRLEKKRSLTRVTLFSGGGTSSVGMTGGG